MTDIQHSVVAFTDQCELSVVRQALSAIRDCIDLKREIDLPVVPETRQAIDELEGEIFSLKLELLRALSQNPDQLTLSGMPMIFGLV